MSNNTQVAGHVIIEDYAILGGMCAIHQFVKIGRHSFLQGGSLVGKDIPPLYQSRQDATELLWSKFCGTEKKGFQY